MYKKNIFLIRIILILTLLLAIPRMFIARAIDGFHPPITALFPTSRMIMIFDTGLDMHILLIDRYTAVTWINDSHSGVRIEFGKGPNCREISTAAFPVLGIRMQPDKCFITSIIPPKGTLRFRFKEFGDYKYKVEYVGKNIK